MIVNQNGMTYDSADPRCQCFVGGSDATGGLASYINIAFITVVDDDTQSLKRYFGLYRRESEESSIREIMDRGGKWPEPFKDAFIPDTME